MKKYINQFYSEGFATTFIKKPIYFINNKIKNKTIKTILSYIIYIIYTVLVISFALYYLYIKIK